MPLVLRAGPPTGLLAIVAPSQPGFAAVFRSVIKYYSCGRCGKLGAGQGRAGQDSDGVDLLSCASLSKEQVTLEALQLLQHLRHVVKHRCGLSGTAFA